MHFKALEIFNKNHNSYSVTNFSNLVNIKKLGRDNMFKWLESENIIYKKFDEWTPYREYIEKDYFEVIEKFNKKANKYIKTLKITPKGAVWLHKRLLQAGYNPRSICEIVLENQADNIKMAFGMSLVQARSLRK